jgi:methylmalonyl-CoA mutase
MPPAHEEPPAEFPAADLAQWRQLAAAALRTPTADDPIEALSTTTYDGVRIRPLYTAEDALHRPAPGRPPFVRGATADGATATGWDVRTRLADPDPRRVRASAGEDLQLGATSLWLVLGEGGSKVADLPAVLPEDALGRVPIVLDAGPRTAAAADLLLRIATDRGVEPSGSLGADPIGCRARTGADADPATVTALAQRVASFRGLLPVTVDATAYHDAGASDADEIAMATAVGIAYLRALTDAGTDLDSALAGLEFRFAVTADQFLSIAKLRAARRVWDRVAELCGAGPHRRGQRQHAVTSAAMMTRRDPWVNMLRTTVACFAAAVGGAEAITVLPFDSAIGIPDGFGRRIARNTSAILHDESSLSRVVDPGGGSWYVEQLTEGVAECAWEGFTAIERAGGALAALDSGLLWQRIDRVRAGRERDVATRRAPLIGVSEFALVTEAPVVRPPAAAPLSRHRCAEPYEDLRDRADAAVQRPRVLLVALGARAASAARVAFASGFFQAGGVEPVVTQGVPDDLADARVACLCGSDEDYRRAAAAAARALRAAGAREVWLAGCSERYGNVDGTIAVGDDAVAALGRILDLLEVP